MARLTVAQLARELAVHHQTVRRWIRSGRIVVERLPNGRGGRRGIRIEWPQPERARPF